MNRALVEEITRLVIEKLHDNRDGTSLSGNEIDDWNRISNSINNYGGKSGFSYSNNSNQLTDDEINNWLEITSTFSIRNKETAKKNDLVKIQSYK